MRQILFASILVLPLSVFASEPKPAPPDGPPKPAKAATSGQAPEQVLGIQPPRQEFAENGLGDDSDAPELNESSPLVHALTLPAEVSEDAGKHPKTILTPKLNAPKGVALIGVRWAYLATFPLAKDGASTFQNSLILDTPSADQRIYVYANALLLTADRQPVITEHAFCVVSGKAGQPPPNGGGTGGDPPKPGGNPTVGEPTPIPPTVKGLTIAVVAGVQSVNGDLAKQIAALTASERIDGVLLKSGNGYLHSLDPTSKKAVESGYAAKAAEVGLPAILVIDPNRHLLPAGKAIHFDWSRNPDPKAARAEDEFTVLDAIGRAAGGSK